MNEGQRVIEAWRRWLATDEGIKCVSGSTEGIYLKNRLERAFVQGWTEGHIDAKLPRDAASNHIKGQE